MDELKTKMLVVENVSKQFNLGFKKQNSALSRAISLFSGKESNKLFTVIQNISFNANKGEIIGLIGKNGSGKSTLLRLIAGIYEVDSGLITLNGKVVYLNGFGLGLKERLTMRENIYFTALLMGLNHKEINNKFNEIVNFSELGEYLDTKIYQFSSGMASRLRFAITASCLEAKKGEIILLDEVFGSGGDFEFKKKAIEKMENFVNGGATIILVSHDLEIIEKYCTKVILLQKGRIVLEAPAKEAINKYLT